MCLMFSNSLVKTMFNLFNFRLFFIPKALRKRTVNIWVFILVICVTLWGENTWSQTRPGFEPTETLPTEELPPPPESENPSTPTEGLDIHENDPVVRRRQERLRVLEKEIELLEKQQKILEQEKSITGTERKIFDGLLPNVTDASKPLEGKFEGFENLQAESRFMIIEGVEKIAETIKKRIPNRSTVIIYDTELINFLSEYQLLNAQLELLIAKYEDYFPENIASEQSSNEFGTLFPQTQFLRTFEGLTRVTRSVIDFVALFRTQREFSEVESSFLTDEVLATNIAAKISLDNTKNIDVYYPNIYVSSYNISKDSETAEFIRKKQQLSKLLERGEQALKEDSSIEGLSDLNKTTGEFLETLDISKVFKGLNAYKLLQEADDPYILYIKLIYALGNNQSSRNLFTGTTIRHSGNVMLSYILFDKEGRIYNSDLLYYHSGFEEFDAPRNNLRKISLPINNSTDEESNES